MMPRRPLDELDLLVLVLLTVLAGVWFSGESEATLGAASVAFALWWLGRMFPRE